MGNILYYDDARLCLCPDGALKLVQEAYAAERHPCYGRDSLFMTEPAEGLAAEIDSLSEADTKSRDSFVLVSAVTPFVFRMLGLEDLSVLSFRSKLALCLFRDSSVRHGHSDSISKDILKQVLSELANPLYIFRSATVPSSLVASYGVPDKTGDPVVSSLSPGRMLSSGRAHVLTSVYGKTLRSERAWSHAELLCYEDNLRSGCALRLGPLGPGLRVITKSELLAKA